MTMQVHYEPLHMRSAKKSLLSTTKRLGLLSGKDMQGRASGTESPPTQLQSIESIGSEMRTANSPPNRYDLAQARRRASATIIDFQSASLDRERSVSQLSDLTTESDIAHVSSLESNLQHEQDSSQCNDIETNKRSTRTLAKLCMVRRDGMNPDAQYDAMKKSKRFHYSPVHALTVVLILSVALCASLTMLIKQSMNYVAAQSHYTVSTDKQNGGHSTNTDSGKSVVIGDDSIASDNDETDNKLDNDSDAEPKDPQSAQSDEQLSDNGNADIQNNLQEPIDSSLLDLNTASSEQLEALNGVGPVTAANIISHRSRIGRFSSVDQLLEIKGIGAKTLEKIRPQVRVS